mmetsp:Transcript_17561/g.17525  ORF Transcript_17561/g.17525 Transcript_17561/m.17525 type:complete len:262 (-) Transcript_17561:26-811(-)
MDPNEMKPEQLDILEALYKDAEGEEGELEDDFLQLANQEGEEELEEVMKEYESDSESEKEEPRGLVPKSVLDEAMEEFVQEHPTMFGETNLEKEEEEKEGTVHQKKITYEKIKPEEDHVMQRILAELVEEEPEEVEIDVPEPEYKVREDDINSVTSTYTNTDNRPIVVSVRSGADKKNKKLKREGEKEDEKEENKKQPGHRERGETKEEKKKRKEEIKAQKKESRERKKNIKILYKVEKSKQNELKSGTGDVASGYSIIKL